MTATTMPSSTVSIRSLDGEVLALVQLCPKDLVHAICSAAARAGRERGKERFDLVYGTHILTRFDTAESIGLQQDASLYVVRKPPVRVLMVSADGHMQMFNSHSAEPLCSFSGLQSRVLAATASPDGRKVLSMCVDGAAQLFDSQSGMLQHTLSDHYKSFKSGSFSPDSSTALVAGGDCARLFNVDSGACILSLNVPLGNEVKAAAFSPDGCMASLLFSEGFVMLFEVKSGGQMVTIPDGNMRTHFKIQSVKFSPDGEKLLAVTSRGAVLLFNTRSGKRICDFLDDGRWFDSATFSPDGSKVLAISTDCDASLFDAEFGSVASRFKNLGYYMHPHDMVFSPDGTKVLFPTDTHMAKVFHVGVAEAFALQHTLAGHSQPIGTVAFSPDGDLVLTASSDGHARLYNSETGSCLHTLSAHAGGVSCASFVC
mmetsp:Transcript_10479/g.19287  ORF Transcript_10479/g.19287 Transcript_10479/m.19287 type:complete len:428 (+) Transcript_10479:74-1357(+)